MLQPIQIIMALVAVWGITRAILNFRKSKLTVKGFIFWFFIWFAIGVLAFVPQVVNLLSKPIGVGRGIDLLVYLSIVLLFYLVFKIFVKIESIEQEITKIVRKMTSRKD